MATSNRQFLVRTGLNLPAGTQTGPAAPLTFQPGQNLTTAVTGSVEWDGYNLFVTEGSSNTTTSASVSSTTRRTVAYVDSTMTGAVGTVIATGQATQARADAAQASTDIIVVNTSTSVNTGEVDRFGTITPGSGYTNGTYNNVTLTHSSGATATTYPVVNIVVANTVVSTVTLVSGGTGFTTTSTVMSATTASIGGTGSGFAISPSAFVTTDSGIRLPPAIPGRTVRVANNTSNSIRVYTIPNVTGVTVGAGGATTSTTTIPVTSTTGLLPGMILGSVSGGGAFASNTVIVSIGSNQIIINQPPQTALVATATFQAGTDATINGLTSSVGYGLVAGTSVEFVAESASHWLTSSSASIAGNNGSGGSATSSAGAIAYAIDTYGTLNFIADVAAGSPLLSAGIGVAPTYGPMTLSSTLAVTGVLPIANGGTGSNGTALLSTGSGVYSLVTASTAVLIGAATSTVSVSNLTASQNLTVAGTTNLLGNTTIGGNLTVSGTQFIINATTSAFTDTIMELQKPSANALMTSDTNLDVGLKYHYATSTPAAFVIAGATSTVGTATLTLASSEGVIFPIGTVIDISSPASASIGIANGTYVIIANNGSGFPRTVSFLYGNAVTANTNIGKLTVRTQIAMTSGSIAGTVATVSYSNTTTLIQNSSYVTLFGFAGAGGTSLNGTQQVTSAGNGTFTFATSGTGAVTAATGTIVFGDLYAFSGYADDTNGFEFYSEGYENSGVFSGQYGSVKGGTLWASPAASQSLTALAAGSALKIPASKVYDNVTVAGTTAGSTPATAFIGQQTIGTTLGYSGSAVTYTNAASLYIENAPVAVNTSVNITNPYSIYVASGKSLFNGDVQINGTNITTTATTMNLFATNVATAYAFDVATSVYIARSAAAATTLTIGNNAYSNTLKISSVSAGTGTATLSTDVTTGIANIFTSVTGTIYVGGAASTVQIGTTAGNSTLNIAGVNGAAGTATITTTTGVVTANVFNSIASIGNLFGAATTVNIANVTTSVVTAKIATAASSGGNVLTFGPNVGTNTIKIGAAASGSAILDTPTATAIGSLFPTITGTVELGKAAATINIGGATTTATIGTTAGNSTAVIAAQSGGVATIITTASVASANVFNTVVTSGNIFGTATAIGIGNTATSLGTVSVLTASATLSALVVGNNASSTNYIKIGASATAILDTVSAGAVGSIFPSTSGNIYVGAGSANIYAGVTGGATLYVGQTGNSTLNIAGVNGTAGTATITTTTGVVTANVFNSIASIGNLFGAATAVNIGSATSVAATASLFTTSSNSALILGNTANTSGTNTIKINGGTGATVSLDSPAGVTGTVFPTITGTVGIALAATTINVGTAAASATTVTIGNSGQNNTLKINGNGTGGSATLGTNVTTGSVTMFNAVTGTVTIGGTSISTGNGVVKLGVSPSPAASGNEVVTAEWVLNNTNSTGSISVNLGNTTSANQAIDTFSSIAATAMSAGTAYTILAPGTTTFTSLGAANNLPGTAFVATGSGNGTGTVYASGQAFLWNLYRAAKYNIQVTQVGSKSTRAQTSEMLVTHDAPYLLFQPSSTIGTATTTIPVANTSGLYRGMTVSIQSSAAPSTDLVNNNLSGVTTIASVDSATQITVANTVVLNSATKLQAVLATSFSATLAATTGPSIPFTSLSATTGAVYPGMNLYMTATPGTTYLVTAVGTAAITITPAMSSVSGAIAGAPNVYTTEYAALETNGTITAFTAVPVSTDGPFIQLQTAATLSTSNTTISGLTLGTLSETVVKMERRLIELY